MIDVLGREVVVILGYTLVVWEAGVGLLAVVGAILGARQIVGLGRLALSFLAMWALRHAVISVIVTSGVGAQFLHPEGVLGALRDLVDLVGLGGLPI